MGDQGIIEDFNRWASQRYMPEYYAAVHEHVKRISKLIENNWVETA